METAFYLLIFVILSLTFTITSMVFKKGYLAFAGSGSWIITGIHSFTLVLSTWDVFFCLGFLFIMLAVVESFSPLAWRETTPDNEMSEDAIEMKAEMEAWDKERGQFSFLRKPSRRRRVRW
jgi:membrane protein implicated in regulation of membrane protease activity